LAKAVMIGFIIFSLVKALGHLIPLCRIPEACVADRSACFLGEANSRDWEKHCTLRHLGTRRIGAGRFQNG
jgi:hypothetical protein